MLPQYGWEKLCVAPTVAELGEWLPQHISKHPQRCYTLLIKRIKDSWRIVYYNTGDEKIAFLDTEANARAKMLIWLIENGYVNMEINNE